MFGAIFLLYNIAQEIVLLGFTCNDFNRGWVTNGEQVLWYFISIIAIVYLFINSIAANILFFFQKRPKEYSSCKVCNGRGGDTKEYNQVCETCDGKGCFKGNEEFQTLSLTTNNGEIHNIGFKVLE